jgi:hypothetical protein
MGRSGGKCWTKKKKEKKEEKNYVYEKWLKAKND